MYANGTEIDSALKQHDFDTFKHCMDFLRQQALEGERDAKREFKRRVCPLPKFQKIVGSGYLYNEKELFNIEINEDLFDEFIAYFEQMELLKS